MWNLMIYLYGETWLYRNFGYNKLICQAPTHLILSLEFMPYVYEEHFI